MTTEGLAALLSSAAVDPAVHELRPDYVALLVAADGLPGGPSDEASDGWLREAESAARERLAGSAPEERPTSRSGAMHSGRSGRSPSGPATASRRCFAGSRTGSRGSTG
jgi:hypothetical protein